jgi:hypothetical protein
MDSSKYYFNNAIALLEKQSRNTSIEYTDCLSSLGILLGNIGDFKHAEQKWRATLSIAARVGKFEMLQKLLEGGAEVNFLSVDGRTSLDSARACSNGSLRVYGCNVKGWGL